MEEFKEESRRVLPNGDVDSTFSEWMFGSQDRKSTRTEPSADLQWGSDASFNPAQAYRSDAHSETVESLHQQQMQFLESFDMNQSAVTSQQNSPSAARSSMSPSAKLVADRPSDDTDAPPRKRRKSKNTAEQVEQDDQADDNTTAPKVAPRKKGTAKIDRQLATSPSDESGKRRKASLASSKQPRENLSEEQKRENHIRSEQKRRTLIKEGFDDLCELVPGLRGGGFSKSSMLSMTAEWLEDMLQGNRELSIQLSSLEGR